MGDGEGVERISTWWTTLPALPNGLLVGLDGSLVDPTAFARRYGRGADSLGPIEPPDDAEADGPRLEVPDTLRDSNARLDRRSETEKDRGRLSYSPQLRRLAGVTQVVSPDLAAARLHSRASHTHKVALIAREIAEKLTRTARFNQKVADQIKGHGGLDIPACEAAALAHDLGHPPYGHVGEQILNQELRRAGIDAVEGFEGNAQSFRIVTRIAKHPRKSEEEQGLDLTNVTLAAILKYPWTRNLKDGADEAQKFGAFGSEADILKRVRDAVIPGNDDASYLEKRGPIKPRQSLEASIMDLADDIAYSIHDLEDFCAQGSIDIARAELEIKRAHQFFSKGQARPKDAKDAAQIESNVFVMAHDELEKYHRDFESTAYISALTAVDSMLSMLVELTSAPTNAELETMLRKLLSRRVNNYFSAIVVEDDVTRAPVRLRSPEWHDMQVLKQVTKGFLVASSKVGQIQRAQTTALRTLILNISRWLEEAKDTSVLPMDLQDILSDQNLRLPTKAEGMTPLHHRAVCDYICGMSDSEAFQLGRWLEGAEVPGMGGPRLH